MAFVCQRPPIEVTAIFKDTVLTFAMPRDATLTDLIEQLAGIEERQHCLPLHIKMKIA